MFRKIHNLRTRTLLYLLLLLSGFALASYWTTSHLLQRSLLQFEERHAQEELERVRAVLAAEAQGLLGSAVDYGFWDDTYEYLQQGNPDYLTSNFTADSMRNLRVDFAVFLTAAGQPHSAFDIGSGQLESLAAGSGKLREVQAGLAALTPTLQQKGAYLLRWIDGIPALLAYSPVLDNSRTQPRRGWLVLGRLLDDDGQAELAQLVSTAFQLAPAAAASVQPPRTAPNSIRVSRVLEDSLGSSALRLIIQHPPILHSQKHAGNLLLIGNSLVILVLAVLAAAALLDRLILKRLSLFSRLAEQRQRVDEQPPVWPVQGHDELDKLAQSLNELMAEVHSAHANLYQDARKDPLTGLGNRKFLGERLPLYQAIQQRQPELALTIYLIDLDDFKLINDCLGHEAGDALLDSIAQRLRVLIRASDTAVRMGGDEFAVLSLESAGQGSHILAQRLLEEICQPLMFQGSRLAISGSIGIAHAAPGMSQEELLRNADIAMYQAKRAGKSRYAFYSAAMHANVQERMFIEQRLRQALIMGQLEVWFQPIVDCATQEVVMVEALARWPTDAGFCPPDKFIPVAEEAGLIGELGHYIARHAVHALPRLQQLRPGLALNINLSVKQLLQVDLVSQLCELIDAEPLSRHSVHFELTESAFSENLELLQQQVNALVAAGFKLHLDDFGTGYSSLQRLQHLPMSALKLDKSFTRLLEEGDERIVKVILSLGEQLQMSVIAEGVETLLQQERLQALGCRLMQGYLFAKPMPEAQLLDWLQARETTASPPLES
ncbi:bifunctional diguanylate cyclase/phosphodiesterase [Pseudomonas sp. 2FE]|uniref:putative bifunctional diguanylate cyclase/phosphodiesterase n=1 Tax=Pseudomonas sp. 2FE TaxID=2502190 RepID=UPI0014857CD1|nr:EAL domain-containing protein [Pseudomonas sp. 2FE]